VPVRLLHPSAKLPFRASASASGYDLHACLPDGPLELGQVPALVPTGVAMAVPDGFDAQVRPRSGLARQGVIVAFGTVDADYRGELLVTMYTTSPAVRHTVRDGDRIAQVVISRLAGVEFVEAAMLDATARGEGGHGSTGR
jgi:dUTP pyrophosphatase